MLNLNRVGKTYPNGVRALDASNFRQGTNRVLWDGTDQNGRALPSGTYLVRVTANNSTATQRVTILH